MNVAKIHRKLMITESQFYFTNISATKARIFMKFYVVNYYLMSLGPSMDPAMALNTPNMALLYWLYICILCNKKIENGI